MIHPRPSSPQADIVAGTKGASHFAAWAIAAAVSVMVATAYLLSFADTFPYYFMYDMDQFVLIDYLRVRNGEIPNQLHHPSFGLYPIFRLTEAVWRTAESVPSYTYQGLVEALSPVFAVAELTSFLRAHSPFIVIFSTVLMAFAVGRGIEAGPRGFVALLLVGLSFPWLTYHASMIRSELYGVFYWSAGLAGLSMAARTEKYWPSVGWLFASGAFLGLSFLSKTQTFMLIALAPVFYFHSLWIRYFSHGDGNCPLVVGPRMVIVAAAMFALLSALSLLALAPAFPIPEGAFVGKYYHGGSASYGISHQMAIFCAVSASAIILALVPASVWSRIRMRDLPPSATVILFLSVGTALAFLSMAVWWKQTLFVVGGLGSAFAICDAYKRLAPVLSKGVLMSVGAIAAAVFAGLLALLWFKFQSRYTMLPMISVVMLFAIAFAAGCGLILLKDRTAPKSLDHLGARAVSLELPILHVGQTAAFLAAGFMGITILHLILGPDMSKGFEHLVLDFKATMLRLESFRLRRGNALDATITMVMERPIPAVLYVGSVLAAAWVVLTRKPARQRTIISLIMASLLGLNFQLLHIVRDEPRDWIYYDVGFYVFGAVNFYTWWIISRPSRAVVVALGLIVAVLFFDNLRASLTMKGYLSLNYHLYGWKRLPFFNFGWSEQGKDYFSVNAMIMDRYGKIDESLAARIVDHARRHKKVLDDARLVVTNQRVTAAQIGIAVAGQGVWSAEKNWRIGMMPEFLVGATVIDVRAGAIDPQAPKWQVKYVDKVRSLRMDAGIVGQNLALLRRSDLGVYLFIPEAMMAGLGMTGEASATDHVIQLEEAGGGRMSFRGIRVDNYALFPWENLKQAFLVIADDYRDQTTLH